MSLSELEKRVVAAMDAGHFSCEVCDESVDLDATDDYDAARDEILDHAEDQHE